MFCQSRLLAQYLMMALLCFCSFLPAVAQAKDTINFPFINSFKALPMSQLHEITCSEPTLDDSNWPVLKFTDIKQQKHLCVRATINLEEELAEPETTENNVIFISILAAYKLYWDGELLHKNGTVAATENEEKVGSFRHIISLDRDMLTTGKHLFAMELSTFKVNESISNIAYLLLITDHQALSNTILFISNATSILIGALIILFILFLTLYVTYSRQHTLLIFSLLCLSSAVLLIAEQWKLWFSYPYDFHLTRLIMVVSITFIVSLLLPRYYLLQHRITPKLPWFVLAIACAVGCLLLAEDYDTRSQWLFVVSLSISLLINLWGIKSKRPYAIPSFIVLLLSLAMLIASPLYFLEFGFGLAIALVIVSIWFSLIDQMKQQRDKSLETAKLKGELLRRNLQPHFLMNCLTQVQELIDTAPAQANQFVGELADEFRALVQMSTQSTVPLKHEIELCQKHLNIMSVRYQKNYQLDVTGNSHNVLVPSAILHSQIENCFTHNRIQHNQNLSLQIESDNEWIKLILKTPIESDVNHEGLGIGEDYIRSKLEETCGEHWQLKSEQLGDFWVTHYRYKLDKSELNQTKLKPA